MPGSSVSIVDYLAIEIACHHTSVQRSLIAGYFDITVNALNARLRTCADRLEAFPNLVTYGVNLLELSKQHRPDFENRVHPIWELSRRLIDSHQNGTLEEDLDGQDGQRGALLSFLLQTDFRVNGHMPRERPKDHPALFLPRGRKRKHGNETTTAENGESITKEENSEPPKLVLVPATESNKKPKPVADVQSDDERQEAKAPAKTAVVEKATGKGSRSEPYSEHELCTIYIARRIRLLDWDTISFALSRFRTPTVAILADARTAFDQYHDLILDTLRCCCWPQDSMYLISCAANECLAARDRGQWLDEVKAFKNEKGELWHSYMQKRFERIYRKSFEMPKEKRQRRRRERLLGYEGLSVEDYMSLPAKKKGAVQPGKSIDKVRKRRTKEEMARSAEEKAAAKALLKANGLKANGEALAEKRKGLAGALKAEAAEQEQLPEAEVDDSTAVQKKKVKTQKAPRRKYDIPEQERLTFKSDSSIDRRQRYDISPDEKISARASTTPNEIRASNGSTLSLERSRSATTKSILIGHDDSDDQGSPDLRNDAATLPVHKRDSEQVRGLPPSFARSDSHHGLPPTGYFSSGGQRSSNGHYASEHQGYLQTLSPRSQVIRSPQQAVSIGNLVDRPQNEMLGIATRNHAFPSTGSFESAAASLIASTSPPIASYQHARSSSRDGAITQESPKSEKPRSAMSLSALLN